MRTVVTVITALVAVLTVAPAAVAQTPAATVTVTQFDCESVTVTGSGWEQTEATVEVGVLPPESGEVREDLIAGPIQVFPDEQGDIAPTVVPFNRTPPDGDHTAVVLVDGLVRGQSPIFTLTGCGAVTAPTPPSPPTTSAAGPTLPATGSSTMPLVAIGVVLVTLGFALVQRTRTN